MRLKKVIIYMEKKIFIFRKTDTTLHYCSLTHTRALEARGKRRDSIYSKKILEYKRSTTGVEWSISGIRAE